MLRGELEKAERELEEVKSRIAGKEDESDGEVSSWTRGKNGDEIMKVRLPTNRSTSLQVEKEKDELLGMLSERTEEVLQLKKSLDDEVAANIHLRTLQSEMAAEMARLENMVAALTLPSDQWLTLMSFVSCQ